MKTGYPLKRGQGGFTAIEMLVVVTVIAIVAAYAVVERQQARDEQLYRSVGGDLSQVAGAMSRYLADSPVTGVTFTDFSFLREAGCSVNPGAASEEYLPCSFGDGLRGTGLSYQITLIDDNGMEVVEMALDAIQDADGNLRPERSGSIAATMDRHASTDDSILSVLTQFEVLHDPDQAVVGFRMRNTDLNRGFAEGLEEDEGVFDGREGQQTSIGLAGLRITNDGDPWVTAEGHSWVASNHQIFSSGSDSPPDCSQVDVEVAINMSGGQVRERTYSTVTSCSQTGKQGNCTGFITTSCATSGWSGWDIALFDWH